MRNVNMGRAAYNSQVRKFNSFIQNGLFGRDTYQCNVELSVRDT